MELKEQRELRKIRVIKMSEEKDNYTYAFLMLILTGIYFGLYISACMRLFE